MSCLVNAASSAGLDFSGTVIIAAYRSSKTAGWLVYQPPIAGASVTHSGGPF